MSVPSHEASFMVAESIWFVSYPYCLGLSRRNEQITQPAASSSTHDSPTLCSGKEQLNLISAYKEDYALVFLL